MRQVILINPPLNFDIRGRPHSIDTTVPPLGILSLAAYLNRYSNQFKVEVLDIGAEKINIKEMKAKIMSADYWAVGITAMTPQLPGALELAQLIKTWKKIIIFLGGAHISADPGFINRHPDVFDYVILGEAEKIFLDSLNKLSAGQEIARIQTAAPIDELDV